MELSTTEAKQMKPIIFSTPMVRAILAGRKTQTRRIIKDSYNGCWTNGGPHPCPNEPVVMYPGEIIQSPIEGEPDIIIDGDKVHAHFFCSTMDKIAYCPYGKVGDILYVRETGVRYHTINHIRKPSGASFSEVSDGLYAYKADGFETLEELRTHIRLMSDASFEGVEFDGNRWHPSIHMPKWAARIFLKITDISVERLQDITEEDSVAEGVLLYDNHDGSHGGWAAPTTYRESFQLLWGKINGENSWNENPWIWKITFERIEKP